LRDQHLDEKVVGELGRNLAARLDRADLRLESARKARAKRLGSARDAARAGARQVTIGGVPGELLGAVVVGRAWKLLDVLAEVSELEGEGWPGGAPFSPQRLIRRRRRLWSESCQEVIMSRPGRLRKGRVPRSIA
jgi:hypothetical protein